MADAFLTALFGAQTVKATARVKHGPETRTVTLRTVPADVSSEAFASAARDGVDLSVRVTTDDDRTRTLSGKGVFGAAAVSATCSVLGYVPTPADPDPVPTPTRKRARAVEPSANGTHATDATVS